MDPLGAAGRGRAEGRWEAAGAEGPLEGRLLPLLPQAPARTTLRLLEAASRADQARGAG